MSDSWTPYNDTQAEVLPDAEQLLEQRSCLVTCAENLGAKGYSAAVAEDISKELLNVRQSLSDFECGLQFTKDLAVANQLVATQPDHRSVGVLRYGLEKLADYLANTAKHGADSPVGLLTAFNELFALQKKPLLTENLFSVPDEFRIDVNSLGLVDQKETSASTVPERYLGFSQTMLGVYRGEGRGNKLKALSELFTTLSNEANSEKTYSFWLLCKTFVATIKIPKGELSPALFKIFKDLESVLFFALGDKPHPVLGMQQTVDRLLINLLCYIDSDALPDSFVTGANRFAGVPKEIHKLHQLSSPGVFSPQSSFSQSSSPQYSAWVKTSVFVLTERLQHCSAILSEEALDSDESVASILAEVTLLKRLLVIVGVHGARENLEEVEGFLRKSLTSETMQSSHTSVQLVEQQMLYQFGFLGDTNTSTSDSQLSETAESGSHQSLEDPVEPAVARIDPVLIDSLQVDLVQQVNSQSDNASQDFGARCNQCIDVIQQSLDTALGSSGNLIPDSSVVNALSKLIDLVSSEGIAELTELLTPLSQLLTEAADSTLNQSDTLLVQEAIIAATLGIDSLVGHKPMPGLVTDVTRRVNEVLHSTTKRLNDRPIRNSAHSGFLSEAGELLPRLFELFQRLRGAPDSSSRLYTDINRLLHSFKVSADEADELHLAEIAHTLESTMVDLTQSDVPAPQRFFDVAIESVECLDEEIERLRNSEPAVDRSDLIDRLKLEGALDGAFESSGGDGAASVYKRTSPTDVVLSRQPEQQQQLADTEFAEKQTGAILLNSSAMSSATIDWSERFRQIEACCNAIGSSHKQLLDLHKRAEQVVNTANLETANVDEGESAAESNKALQSFTAQLQQITESQNTAVRQLDQELGNASMLDAASLGASLLKTVEVAAVNQHLQVQFAFESGSESGGVMIHRDIYARLGAALSTLLDSIVAHAITDNEDSADCATIAVNLQQKDTTLFIDVIDDGCGVSVQGVTPRSGNPWTQVARPDWREVGGQKNTIPQAWSRHSDHVIDINALLKIATRHGGTVAIKSNEDSTCYRLCLPVVERAQAVLVVEVFDHLLAIPAAMVESVGITEVDNVTSLGQLLGLKKQAAFRQSQGTSGSGSLSNPALSNRPLSNQTRGNQALTVRSASGLQQFAVDRIVGHRALKFSAADRVLPDVPGYTGVSASASEQLVMLLDIDYWCAQQQ